MANSRTITSDIWEDDFFGELSLMAKLLWIGLFSRCADDQGRMIDNSTVIKSKIFPYDAILETDIDLAINHFKDEKKLIRYEVNGKCYIQLIKWWENQHPQWAMPSKYPAPEGWTDRIRMVYKGQYTVENWPTKEHKVVPQPIVPPGHPTWTPQVDTPPGQPTRPPQVARHNLNLNHSNLNQEQKEEGAQSGNEPPAAAAADYQSLDQKAIQLLSEVTGWVSFPGDEQGRMEQFVSMIQQYGYDPSKEALVTEFDIWKRSPRKNGTGNYNTLRMVWADRAMNRLAGNIVKVEKSLDEMTHDEQRAYWEAQAAAGEEIP